MAAKKKPTTKPKPPTKSTLGEVPPGFTLRTECRAPEMMTAVVWARDGRSLFSASANSVWQWDVETGAEQRRVEVDPGLENHTITLSPDGNVVAVMTSRELHLLASTQLNPLASIFLDDLRTASTGTAAWSPDSRFLAVPTSPGPTLIDCRASPTPTIFKGLHSTSFLDIQGIAWSPDGRMLATGDKSRIAVFDPQGKSFPHVIDVNTRSCYAVAWSPDSKYVAGGGDGSAIQIFDAESGRVSHTIEGPFGIVEHICFSSDGQLLAARDFKAAVWLWRTDTWHLLARLPGEQGRQVRPASFSFHPSQPSLATLAEGDRGIRIWDLDLGVLLDSALPRTSVRYQNAKIVLVGDTGVGKSGLTDALSGKPFTPTESTHGRRVVTFERLQISTDAGDTVARESLLWDLAGQPGYRLVHQIQMDEAAVALVLFDARSETDPFGAAAYWAEALDQAKSNTSIVKFLVAARTDRGGVGVGQRRIDEFVKRHGFADFFRTSAKTGSGVKELAEAIRAAIRWHELPVVSSTKLFTDVRDFVKRRRAKAKTPPLCTVRDLYDTYRTESADEVAEADFDACLRRLQATDIVDILVFSALDERAERRDYVLVEPSYVDAYASTVVTAAKDEPDGIGHLRETDILEGKFEMDPTERLRDRGAERLVLVATVERLLQHEIALRERIRGEDFLVFPSQYTRPAPFPGSKSYGVSYEFSGPLRSIFTTLVVRLAHASDFKSRDFWRDAASYESIHSGRCIVLFEDLQEGRGRMTVFFEDAPPETVQRTFLEYVYDHLAARAVHGSVKKRRAYHCPKCHYRMDDEVVEDRLRRSEPDIICPRCDERSPLYDMLFPNAPVPREVSERMVRIDADANRAKLREIAAIALQGKMRKEEYDVFLSYKSDDRPLVLSIAQSLKSVGLRPWLDVWDLIPGRPWQEELEKAIPQVKTAAICYGPSGLGPWEDREMRAFLGEFVHRRARVIPVVLPGVREIPTLPVFLREFTWVDLRSLDPLQPNDLKALIAGIIDRRPDDRLWEELDNVLRTARDERALAATISGKTKVLTLRLRHERAEIKELDLEAIRAQLAEELGANGPAVRVAGASPGNLRLALEFHRTADVERLAKLIRGGAPSILERFARWRADPEYFLVENEAAVREFLEPRGGEARSNEHEHPASAPAVAEPAARAAATNLVTQLTQLRDILATRREGAGRTAAERALGYAMEEALSGDPDYAVIASSVVKCLRSAPRSTTVVEAVHAIAASCGDPHRDVILAALP